MTKSLYCCNYACYKGVLAIAMMFYWNIHSSSSYMLHPLVEKSRLEHWNHTAISDFRLINRRALLDRSGPFQKVRVDPQHTEFSHDQYVEVTVTGIKNPLTQPLDWVAMVSPSSSDTRHCAYVKLMYTQTGDSAHLPLLCHYPVKAQYAKSNPDYLACTHSECKHEVQGVCLVTTCSATLTFHIVNIRTDISFVMFSGGFDKPSFVDKSDPISFSNPNMSLYGHLSSVDSTGTSMRLTWVSGDRNPQEVEYTNENGRVSRVASTFTNFTPDDMCGSVGTSPAKDFGWHDPGHIHSAIMTGLEPSSTFTYKYGSNSVGWSERIEFRTPPAAGANEVKFLAYGDLGKAPLDDSVEHYIQPGSVSVVYAMTEEVNAGNVDLILHDGGTSFATGFMVEWDYFLRLITPLASRVPYMTAIGNHERDYRESPGSVYSTTDSGGECGVPYERYFQMPVQGTDQPWYSIEQGPVHFIVISTENNWSLDSEQHKWIKNDLASVDRSKTPWVVFSGHRPMYSSYKRTTKNRNRAGTGLTLSSTVDENFVAAMEPLLSLYKVDLVLQGHVHNYERTCSVLEGRCTGRLPKRDERTGADRYDLTDYTGPVQVVIGMAGFELDIFPDEGAAPPAEWSLIRRSMYGYLRVHATRQEMKLEFVVSKTRTVEDSFILFKEER